MRRLAGASPLLVALLAIGATGCVSVEHEHRKPAPVVVREPGPPPHAPAHGYRRKLPHDGVEIVFDSGVGVWVVVGQRDCWWDDNRYYRWHDGAWSRATHLYGPWAVVEVSVLPGGLRAHEAKAKGKGKTKHGPASHGPRD